MSTVFYAAGVADAAKNLGLDHRVKTAVLGHALLGGALGHIGVNALGRKAHHASNIAEVLAHKGLQQGYLQSGVTPGAMRSIKAIAGPESAISYGAANKIGRKLADLPPKQREQYIKMLVDKGDNVSAPILSELRAALKHHEAGTSPKLTAEGFASKAYTGALDRMTNNVQKPFDTQTQKTVKNIIGAAPAAGVLAADTVGGAAHFGVNTIRELAGKSSAGKKFMQDNLTKGLSGSPVSKTKEILTDYFVSPGFLTPYRVGKGLRESVPTNVAEKMTPESVTGAADTAKTFLKSLKPTP